MAIGGGWGRYRYEDSTDIAGRLRLVRKDGIFTGYVWQDGDWRILADWQSGFTDPVYLDLRLEWKTPAAEPQTARFVIERLETEEGILIDTNGQTGSP